MITYSEKLILTDKTAKKIDKYKKDIENRPLISGACLITLSASERDVFDIMPSYNLIFKKIGYEGLHIIGIAESKASAVKICTKLTEEYLDSGSKLSMRDYILKEYN